MLGSLKAIVILSMLHGPGRTSGTFWYCLCCACVVIVVVAAKGGEAKGERQEAGEEGEAGEAHQVRNALLVSECILTDLDKEGVDQNTYRPERMQWLGTRLSDRVANLCATQWSGLRANINQPSLGGYRNSRCKMWRPALTNGQIWSGMAHRLTRVERRPSRPAVD